MRRVLFSTRTRWGVEKRAPSAVHCFEKGFEARIAQLHCPYGDRSVIGSADLLERSFEENCQ